MYENSEFERYLFKLAILNLSSTNKTILAEYLPGVFLEYVIFLKKGD